MTSTERMVALLAGMRRERNGAVADTMRYDGRRYGLNYGVSLPTLRRLARAEEQGEEFARYLYMQDVRELHLAALHIMPGGLLDVDSWAAGIYNSEVAEEAAFALLGRVSDFPKIFETWVADLSRPLLVYAALLAAARREELPAEWAAMAVRAVAGSAQIHDNETLTQSRAARLVAQGAVAMLAQMAATGHAGCVRRVVDNLGTTPAENYLREELGWRLE